jgi:CBS domain-containing protein
VSAGAICVRAVQVAFAEETVRAVTRRMAKADVGTVVVVGDGRRPVGVLTDRDVTLRCVAEERDPDTTAVGSVMSAPPACIDESTPIESALSRMAAEKVRRLVVVDSAQSLVGILALDDVLELLAEEATTIGRLLSRRARVR